MQTAIEYIFEQLEEQGLIFLTTKTNEMTISISASDYLDIKRLAKEMEKQHIIDAWNGGDYAYFYSKETGRDFVDGNEYFAETYGSKGSDETNSEKPNETSSQTEISDEEIEYGFEYFQINRLGESQSWESIWKEAIKWYREQLKLKLN